MQRPRNISLWKRGCGGKKNQKILKVENMILFFLWLFLMEISLLRSLFLFISVLDLFSFCFSQSLHVATCSPCFSLYHFPPSSLFFLFYSYCLKPVPQIGFWDPVSQQLIWECPGRGPVVGGVGRDSTPASGSMLLGCKQP